MLTLPSAEAGLLKPEIVGSFTLVPEMHKKLELVGSAYEKIKVKVSKQLAKYHEFLKNKKAEKPGHESAK